MINNDSENQANNIIKRSRDFYLYDSTGKRFLDLDLCRGASVLGHKPNNINNAMKQSLQRGMSGCDMGRETAKVITHGRAFIEGWELANIIVTDIENILKHRYIRSMNITEIEDCIIDGEKSSTVVWRLYSDIPREKLKDISASVLLIPLPVPWKPSLVAVFTREKADIINFEVSEVLLAGVNHIIPYLIAKGTAERTNIHIAKNRKDIFLIEPMHTKSKHYVLHNLSVPDTWIRNGIYVILPPYSKEEYSVIRNECIRRGFYISPLKKHVPRFLTLPPYMTRHEINQWEDLITTVPHI